MSRKNWIRTRISRAGEQRAGPHLIRHGACGRRAATPSPPGEGLGDGGSHLICHGVSPSNARRYGHLILQERAWGGGHPYRPDGHFPQRGKQERGHLIRTSVSPSNAWRYGHLLLQEKAWGRAGKGRARSGRGPGALLPAAKEVVAQLHDAAEGPAHGIAQAHRPTSRGVLATRWVMR